MCLFLLRYARLSLKITLTVPIKDIPRLKFKKKRNFRGVRIYSTAVYCLWAVL